jgi:hypothetical protein
MQKTHRRPPLRAARRVPFPSRVRSPIAVGLVAAGLITLGLVTRASPAFAFPGFIAGKGDTPRVANSTQVVLLSKGDHTVVTVWTDYEGPLDRFAVVLPRVLGEGPVRAR